MYNLWWVVIATGAATIIFSILYCVLESKKQDWFSMSWSSIAACFFAIASGVVCIVMIGIAIYNPLKAKNEYNEFLETKALVERVYQGDYEQYENAGANVKVIELNQWLAHAKSEKRQWGNWSMYCGLDVEHLDYIVLKK